MKHIFVIGPDFETGKPDSLQQTVAAVRPRHNEQRHIKRLSPPVHPGRMDPKKAKRIAKARAKTSVGEYWHNRRKIENSWLHFRKKHNLAPRGPKHNTTRQELIEAL